MRKISLNHRSSSETFEIILFQIDFLIKCFIFLDEEEQLSEILSENDLINLLDDFKKHNISADNIWDVKEATLEEWNVPSEDILKYKIIKKEVEGMFYLKKIIFVNAICLYI